VSRSGQLVGHADFEQNADAYGLSDQQNTVQARGKMVKVAKLFLESEVVNTLDQLKNVLIGELYCLQYSAHWASEPIFRK